MIDLAVLDMAGTTVADDNFVAEAFQKAFAAEGLTVSEADVNPLMGYPKPIAIQMVLEAAGVEADEELVESIHRRFTNEMIAFYEESPDVRPVPGAEDLFLYLQEKGIWVTLNTGFSREIAEVIVKRFQWEDRGLVDDFIASDEVDDGRPEPDMIRALISRNGLPEDAVILKIGDTVADVLEGRNAGCAYNIAVTTGAARREDLEAYGPTHIVEHLGEVPAILEASKTVYA